MMFFRFETPSRPIENIVFQETRSWKQDYFQKLASKQDLFEKANFHGHSTGFLWAHQTNPAAIREKIARKRQTKGFLLSTAAEF